MRRSAYTDIREGPVGNVEAEITLDWWHSQSISHRKTAVANKLQIKLQRIKDGVTLEQATGVLAEMLKVEGNIGVVAEHMFDSRYRVAFDSIVDNSAHLSTFTWSYAQMANRDRRSRNEAYWSAAKTAGFYPKRWEDCASQRDWLHQKSLRIPQFPDPAMASATYSRRS